MMKHIDISIHKAAGNGDIKQVQELLEQGADVNQEDPKEWYKTPLHCAAQGSDYEMIRPCVSQGGHVDMVEFLLARGADIHVKTRADDEIYRDCHCPKFTALHFAASLEGSVDVIEPLLEKGADIESLDLWERTPLQIAVFFQNAKGVRALLERGANVHTVSEGGFGPLHRAAAKENIDVLDALLGAGADIHSVDENGETPLHSAVDLSSANYGNMESIAYLIEKGSDLNSLDDGGNTPLLLAANSGYPEAVKILIEAGANITATNEDGMNALQLLCSQYPDSCEGMNYAGGIEAFISAYPGNALEDIQDSGGRTVLYGAIYEWNAAIVKVLLEKGANVHAKDKGGRTPLYYAADMAWKDEHDIVVMLLKAGADVFAKDEDGKTPLDYVDRKATSYGNTLLLEAGGEEAF